MGYRVIVHDEVRQIAATLPKAALTSFNEALTVLELTPRNGELLNPAKPDGVWELLFHGGRGRLFYLIIEHAVEVHAVDAQHIG
ncbi:hypothetical protein D5S17_22255 [Pseudonocardiaceae bacterium YIM PH 21723]|nr:hypothetical protein D5S17_22255 [Pseudonocardiaceae bacterium YIM PH 21723]